ncbi:DUF2344 domain-containing protein [Candidatus Fermentibacterales bacterium]|nr:DUF2344 domain-containing protein [Candidatus Fermentibacterales bacterium]
MTFDPHPYEPFLAEVQKPQQYAGGEWNTGAPRRASPRVTLLYPDLYELGMSNAGMTIVRHLLLRSGRFDVRRAFVPAPDMSVLLESSGTPLADLEGGDRIATSRAIGFSVSSELLFTNVLHMLRLSGIPVRSADRTEEHPLVIAGGGAVSNPLALEPFVDLFFLGEAEQHAEELFGIAAGSGSRRSRLESAASSVPGVYAPLLGRRPVELQRVPALLRADAPVRPPVPTCAVSHDRAVVEIARGCSRGCRFCISSFTGRPVRERSIDDIASILEEAISSTGWEEAGLLSLSFSDYSDLAGLMARVAEFEARTHTAVSRPSLRPDSLLRLDPSSPVRGRLTLAPETGSELLGRRLNKNLGNDIVVAAAERAFCMGATGIKLYFMIGLPMETEDDLAATARLVREVASLKGGSGRRKAGSKRAVTVSVSPFSPKPHTPLERAPQMPLEELERRLGILRDACGRFARVVWNDPRQAVIEAVLGLGDERASTLLEEASSRGARLDGWSDHLRWEVWEELLREQPGLIEWVRSERDAELPWEFISTGVSRDFLRSEYRAYLDAETTPDCREAGRCSGCGACPGLVTRVLSPTGGLAGQPSGAGSDAAADIDGQVAQRLRVRYGKSGRARFSSHLDMVRLWTRTLRRAGLPVAYSHGHVPRPRLRFGPPLPLGMASEGEYVDVDLVGIAPADCADRLSDGLPEGYSVRGVALLERKAAAPDRVACAARYQIEGLPPDEAWRLSEALASEEAVLETVLRGPGVLEILTVLGSRSNRPDLLIDRLSLPGSSTPRPLIIRKDIYARRGDDLVPLLQEGNAEA